MSTKLDPIKVKVAELEARGLETKGNNKAVLMVLVERLRQPGQQTKNIQKERGWFAQTGQMSSDESDNEDFRPQFSDFEGSTDRDESDVSFDDSDTDYVPEVDSDSEEDSGTSETISVKSNGSSPSGDVSFRLLSDPFSDSRPGDLPTYVSDFEDVHPVILHHHDQYPMNAFDCLQLFLGVDVISSLCEWTNTRAAYFFRDNPRKTKKNFMGKKWTDVTVEEMYIFFALQLLMGITKLPRISDYWSQSLLCTGPPVFTTVMSRNRFSQILRFLRFSHPDNVQPSQPMTRIQTFVDMVREKSMNVFSPGENFAVDESLLLYKGRLRFRQYIKTKRKRFGLKLFALCPSSKGGKGYTWNFCLYTPQMYEEISRDEDLAHLSKSERVPVFLMKSLLNKGRHVVLGRYSSINLAEFLYSKNTLTTGTIRPNRGVPQCLKDQSLQVNQSAFARRNEFLVVKYCDRSPVHVISTKYSAGFVERNRFLKGGRRQMIKKPLPIQKYNEQMGSVDLVDQMLERIDPTRKSYTWFKKLGLHLMVRMVLNSFVIFYNLNNHENRSEFSAFIKTVVHEILSEYSLKYVILDATKNEPKAPRRKRRRTASAQRGPDPQPGTSHQPGTSCQSVHWLMTIPRTEKKRRPQKKCRICTREGKAKWVRLQCGGCEEKPGLCSPEHFIVYHEQ
ncbi:piggyBac transposable element-derived protein 4-like [Macrobrachium nipponense]|uniref:piggyBac transposable element-derived protein 4-like n=1 Tax=Macrobrachium nipponense TaxID=159736 RepID=UPI0030C8756D